MANFRIAQIESDKANLKDGQASFEPDDNEIVYQPTAAAASQDQVAYVQWIRESNGDSVLYNANGIELERITPEGNTAYNGATIPSSTDLLSTLSYEFRKEYVIMADNTTGTNWRAIGCYRNDSGDYLCTTTGAMSFLVMGSSGSFTHYKKTTGNTIGVEYPIGDFTATVIA